MSLPSQAELVEWLRIALEGADPELPYFSPDTLPLNAVVAYANQSREHLERVEEAACAAFEHALARGSSTWSDDLVNSYLVLVGSCGVTWSCHGNLIDRTREALDDGSREPLVRVWLLRTLRDLRHRGTVEFWQDQWGSIGPEASTVVAGALAEIGVRAYFDWVVEATSKGPDVAHRVVEAVRLTLRTLVRWHGRVVPRQFADHHVQAETISGALAHKLADFGILSPPLAIRIAASYGLDAVVAWLARCATMRPQEEAAELAEALRAYRDALSGDEQTLLAERRNDPKLKHLDADVAWVLWEPITGEPQSARAAAAQKSLELLI